MWLSAKTKLYTKWHGKWMMFPNGNVYVLFDCLGRTTTKKWAEFDEDGFGEDYLARKIRVQVGRKWHFDPATMKYFEEPV